MEQEFVTTYIEETQSEELQFENKYRGASYLLKTLLNEGDITTTEYADALVEMKKMKEKEKRKKFPKSA